MTREQAREWAQDPRGGPETPAERRTYETWLECDAELRALAEAQRELFSALDDWPAVEPSADFDRRVRARIAANPAPGGWTERWFAGRWRPAGPAWAAAAMAAVLAAAWLIPAPKAPLAVAEPAGAEDIVLLDRALGDLEMLLEWGEPDLDEADEGRS